MKIIMPITGLALLLFSTCAQPTNQPDMEATNTARQAKIEHNKKLVDKWILEGWNQGRNAEVVAEVFAQDWKDGNPTFPEQPQGIEGAMYYVKAYRNIFPDIQFTITHVIAEEDIVCFRFTAYATHRSEFMGIAATNKRVNISGIVIHRIEDGKFAESWNEIDIMGIYQQLKAG